LQGFCVRFEDSGKVDRLVAAELHWLSAKKWLMRLARNELTFDLETADFSSSKVSVFM